MATETKDLGMYEDRACTIPVGDRIRFEEAWVNTQVEVTIFLKNETPNLFYDRLTYILSDVVTVKATPDNLIPGEVGMLVLVWNVPNELEAVLNEHLRIKTIVEIY